MKRSLGTKVAVIFIGLMILILAAMGVFQYFFIDNYYYSAKEKILLESWNKIRVLQSGGDTEEFQNYCSVNSLTYCLTDSTLSSIYTNSPDGSLMEGRLFGILADKEDDNIKVIRSSETYTLFRFDDRFSGMEYLELLGTLDNGYYYLVTCPVESISGAAAISMRFFIYVGLAAIAAALVAVLLITRRLVRPIKELSGLSTRMAELDFDARYESGGEDEIGELGYNFNRMSEKLEKAVIDLRSANARLQEDIAEKQKLEDMRTEFLSNVSHELKTPLALIQGYAEGLKDNVSDDPESREFYCEVIMDEAGKMNTLVRQLMTLNELEFGSDSLCVERFDLTELIRGVLEASGIMLEQKKARVEFAADRPLMVLGDEFKIEEVMTNYLTNAMNHLKGENLIRITLSEENGTVKTEVFNTGDPIPDEDLQRVWEKFYKVDKARTRAYGGSGIGLSIVKAIMDAHHQKCCAENKEGGVAFSFTLRKG